MRLLPLVAIIVSALAAAGARGQDVQGIAAVVNDDVVSIYDVRQRARLVFLTSGIPDTQENRRRIASQVLRALIDERLQLQESRKRGISVSKREIRGGIAEIERRNRLEPGGLEETLRENGLRVGTLMGQINAGIAWQKLVRRQLGPRVSIGDDEVAEVIARLEATRGQDEYRLAEIYLAVDSPDEEAAIRRTARRMVEQIRAGARFDALAREFSRSATAAVGGDLGWAAVSAIDSELVQALEELEEGAVLDPMRTPSGFRIVSLVGRRKVAAADPRDVKVVLRQVFAPIREEAAEDDITARIARARSARAAVSGCDEAPALARHLGAEAPQDLGTVTMADLSPRIRAAVSGVAVGGASEPLRVPGGLIVLIVCGRQAPAVSLPDELTVLDRLRNRRLDMMARRYLRDLRRAAVIDVRV